MRNASPRAGDEDHAFIARLDDGPAGGIRLAVKDCIDVAGVVTTAGSAAVAETAEPASVDAACLAGARMAGARIVGKTNLHELCFGATGVNPHFGTPRNPLDPSRIPGGSSSGSAVAVATGQADVAYGTDTAGSIRNPAACCGVVGLKTTWGRIPVEGTRALAPSMDTIGPMARDIAGMVTGMALLEPGFAAEKVDDVSAVRVGRVRVNGVDPRIDAAVDLAVAAAGFGVVEVALPGWLRAHEDGRTVMYAEALAHNRRLFDLHRDELGPDVLARFDAAEAITDATLHAARARQEIWQCDLNDAMAGLDALVLPGYPRFPSRLDEVDDASSIASVAVSFAGFPALCLPVPTIDGPPTVLGTPFPASLQLVGRPGSEEVLCGLAGCVTMPTVAHRGS